MRRTLGGALIGVLLLATGLLLRQADARPVQVFATVGVMGGGLVAFICLAKAGLAMLRSPS
jgi:hypothetical protein